MTLNRRRFFKQSSAVALGAFPSLVYRGAAGAIADPEATQGKILVVVQMTGGNDGINTVVPFADEGYAKHRKKLRLKTDRLLKVNEIVGLHPSLRAAADLLDDGRLAIVQGVGYPNPSRSHDTSMAIWHSARIGGDDTLRTHGWLGRAMDQSQDDGRDAATNDPQMILVGDESQPLAIRSRRSTSITLSSVADMRLTRPLQVTGESGTSELTGFVEQTMHNAIATALSLEQMIDQGDRGGVSYPSTRLGHRLQSVSSLIKCGFSTPVYYAIQDGYDTHAAQLPTHGRLLREFSDAIKAFLDDLRDAGLSDRVCVIGFSEFGRRVAENGSAGTDHGTAGPVFLAGDGVRSGLVGKTPNLLDLVDGDLRMSVDFRDVYRDVMADWLSLETGDEPLLLRPSLGLFEERRG